VPHDTLRPPSEPDAAERPERPAWHALDPGEVIAELRTDLDAGLTGDDAVGRLEQHGRNELRPDEPKSNLAILLDQFTSPLIYILLVAGVVTIAIDEYTDAAVIAAVLVINATIGFIQERRADRSVHALMQLASPNSTVVRDGQQHTIDSAELVPGDVVLLSSGTLVPADLRVCRATTLEIDESLLTGESDPTKKTPAPVDADALAADRTSMAHMGSSVVSGRGRAVVVATATETQLGAIAESIRTEEQPETPLQQRMNRFANIIAVAVLASTVAAFALGVALGGAIDEMFLTAVALAVAVVPEGLPVAFTVAMALGVRRMATRNAIVRSLPAVETLGSTNTIGSDKTGTLTENRMTALRAWTADGWFAVRPEDAAEDDLDDHGPLADAAGAVSDRPDGPLASTLRTGVLSNEGELRHRPDGSIEHRGDPTETALLEAALHAGMEPDGIRDRASELAAVPFESGLRYAYVVVDEDGPLLRLKGAPERVLDLCDRIATSEGERPLDPDAVHEAAEAMAHLGLRVLAFAERRLDEGTVDADSPPAPEHLTLTGLVGMQDPPRHGVREAVARCRDAGIRVVMITGDHAVTARAIARDLHLIDRAEDAPVLTGHDLERLDDDELEARVGDVDVFARVAPEHKLRVVQALRRRGDVVAVTGDGVNDAPALKVADIGIAMGRDGTDVAREASDMVLTDDNFVSIAAAVEEGRVVFDNVRKVTYFLLSTGAAAIAAILYSISVGLPLPYVPAALLWLNVVTNGLQDVALAFEPGEPDVLDRPPRRRAEGLVSRVLWERTVLTGLTMAAGSMWVFHWAIEQGLTGDQQRGAALTTLVFAMAVHVYNARSERRSIVVTHVRGNRFLLIATIIALSIHVGASYWGPTQHVLQIAPVTADGWMRLAAVGVAVALVSEAHKAWRR
jgi:magnesium-transporting ATPase (P-type)